MAAGVAVMAALLLAGYRWQTSRDDPAEGAAPRGLGPGMVGIATRGRVRSRDVVAVLVDLATRGHLVIQVVGEGRRRDWVLRAGSAKQQGLSPAEQSFLARVFAKRQKVSLHELVTERRGVVRKLAAKLLAAADKDGWFHPVRASRRVQWWGFLLGVAAAVAVLAVGLGWPAAVLFVLAGGITMYQPQLRARRTARGSAARDWVRVKEQELSSGVALGTAEDVQRELPWLVALGMTSRLPELTRGLDVSAANLQFDWIEGQGGALDVGWGAVGFLGEAAAWWGAKALVGAVAGAAALLDG
ncbi:MAG: DUF2207 domain-containing protein [Propionibacteriaceae bacterium]|nr:DUF2207 domain-containing protein [Propionibacteriaceae bacterium]